MNLSMWMIADLLKQYNCRIDISHGNAEIRGARFFAQVDFLESDIAYIGARNEFFDGHASNGVICSHQNDSIIVDNGTQMEVFNDLLNLFDRYQRWDAELEKAAAGEGSLCPLVSRSGRIFPGRLWIVERGGRVCCSSGDSLDEELFYPGQKDPFVRSSCMHLVDQRSRGHVGRKPFSVPELNLCCMDLYDGSYRVGMIFAEAGDMLEACQMQLMENLGRWVQKWMELHPEREDLPWDGNVLRQMLTETPEAACIRDFSEYLRSIGWMPEDSMVLYLVRPFRENAPSRNVKHLADVLPGTVVTTVEKRILILENCRLIPPEEGRRRLREVAKLENWSVGRSYEFREMKELYQGYRQAKLVLESGVVKGELRSCDEYLLPYVCQLVRNQTSVDLVHPAIRILEEYDRENGTDLMHTLAVYLLCERGQKQTAAMLALHRNSVFYRLNQIQTLCALNLEDPQVRLQLIVSFLLRENGHYPEGTSSE